MVAAQVEAGTGLGLVYGAQNWRADRHDEMRVARGRD
jgi:hypothetical protein